MLRVQLGGEVGARNPAGLLAVPVEVTHDGPVAAIVRISVAPPAALAALPDPLIVQPGETRSRTVSVDPGEAEEVIVVVCTATGGVTEELEVTIPPPPHPGLAALFEAPAAAEPVAPVAPAEPVEPVEPVVLGVAEAPPTATATPRTRGGMSRGQRRWFVAGVVALVAALTAVAAIGPPEDDDEPATPTTTTASTTVAASTGTSLAEGEDGASIAGTVRDFDLNLLPGATVEVVLDGDVIASATTGADGRYEVSGFDSPGQVRIRASAPGFHTLENSVFVDPGGSLESFDISLSAE